MKRVEKYLIQAVLQSIFLILMCLIAMQVFILFVNQMSDLGKGHYHVLQAFQFVLYRLPYELSVSFPVISLLGTLVALSVLANHSELVILRVNGLSILNIIRMVATAGIGLIILVMLVSECLVPKLMFKANTLKLEALNEGHLLRQAHSLWFRNRDNFWYIADVISTTTLHQITVFQTNHLGILQAIEYYPQLDWHQGQWYTHELEKTFFTGQTVGKQRSQHEQVIALPLQPKFFKHLEQNPDEMSLINLWHRVYQLKQGQNTTRDELVLWQRLLQPWNTLMMMILAIPFIFGPLRSSTMGAKLLTGIMVGFAFYILNQMFGFISQVYQLSPILGASMPLLLFSLLGLGLLVKTGS